MALQSYKTVAGRAEDEFTEKRSRFIGYITPAATEEEALSFVSQIKSKHWDATHNVYAYILREGQIKRYSDDGEPQGTAGIPVLDVLQKEGLCDSHGAKIAVEAAQVQYMTPCTRCRLEFDYSLYGKISYLLPQYGAVTQSSDFGAAVRLELILDNQQYHPFCKALQELTSDMVVPQVLEDLYYDMGE